MHRARPPCYALALSEATNASLELIGAKAKNLALAVFHGLPVPAGFVITTDAYRALAGADPAKALANLRSAPWPEAVRTAIEDRLRTCFPEALESTRFAVRSSASGEDSAAASFAGQYHTAYHVRAEDLLDAVRHCFGSLHQDGADRYRAQFDLTRTEVVMAVVVQRMLRCEVSGVGFSADPLSGDPDQLVVHATWGLGAALVDGRVNPDHFVLSRTSGRLVQQRLGSKSVWIAPAPPLAERTASAVSATSPRQRSTPTLDGHQLREIGAALVRCEALFGAPQDIEWGIEDGRWWLLQSRPITATGVSIAVPTPPAGKFVLFKPAVENFTTAFTPLSCDVLGRLARCLGGEVFDGRLYFNLRWLRWLDPYGLDDRELAAAAYLSVQPTGPIRWHRLPRLLLAASFAAIVTGVFHLRTRALPDAVFEQFRAEVAAVRADPTLGPLEAAQRLYLGHRFFDPIGILPLPANITGGRFVLLVGLLRALLKRWAPELPADTAAVLCTGSTGVRSVEMAEQVATLGEAARDLPALVEALGASPLPTLETLRALPGAKEFVDAFDEFIAQHGHRAVGELELAHPRWHEDQGPVLAMVANHLRAGTLRRAPPGKARAAAEAALEDALVGAQRPLGLRLRRRCLTFLIDAARYYAKLRENTRYFHIMTVDVVRQKALSVGQELVAQGRLGALEDVFYLHASELVTPSDAAPLDLGSRVANRRAVHRRQSRTAPPKGLGFAWDPTNQPEPRAGVDADTDRLRGQVAAPGCYRGHARVIHRPSEAARLAPGEILVAPFTDPAWTPLFLIAGAAVVEVGSYLSHAGTVAREVAMPCLVDVPECTQRLRDGDLIEVDAEQGQVNIIERATPDRVEP